MTRLSDIASYIKSTNAGASMLTFDIGFEDESAFRRAVDGNFITPEIISRLYGTANENIRIYPYAPAHIIKITIPRPSRSGGIGERDFDGVQQFAPLLDIEII